MTVVVGVDPGGRWTALVARRGDEFLHGVALYRPDTGTDQRRWTVAPLPLLSGQGVSADHGALSRWSDHGALSRFDLLAVEGVNEPTPHMGTIAVLGLLDTAAVLGAVLGWAWSEPDVWARTVVVPPGAHGKAPAQTYPAPLRRIAGGPHLRAAWDIAGAAVRQARLDAAAGGPG